jgi:excinuclease ABC subunit C
MFDAQKYLSKLPDNPGVYLFYNLEKELIYVGKATSLKSRVGSYFRGPRSTRPIEQLMHEVVDIKWQETDSVLEAVILEANLIHEKQPKYNVDGKDDKSWNYIYITDEQYPRIGTIREHELKQQADKNKLEIKNLKLEILHLFGPYPGLNTKATMKILRGMFQFSTCQATKKNPQIWIIRKSGS